MTVPAAEKKHDCTRKWNNYCTISVAEDEKSEKLEHQDLKGETGKLWNMNISAMPIIVVAVPKTLGSNISLT